MLYTLFVNIGVNCSLSGPAQDKLSVIYLFIISIDTAAQLICPGKKEK